MTHIHYKFSSKLSYDTVVFDGPHTTLSDLKRQIMGREKLRAGDCDLQITNAQTKEEYTEDDSLIPKGSSVIVRRIPIIGGKSSSSHKTHNIGRSDVHLLQAVGASRAMDEQNSTKALSFFSRMQMANLVDADVSEEDKIKVMMNQSAYDSMNLNKKLGTGLPGNYTCYRCGTSGHHIRNCPISGQDKNAEAPPKIKKSTGIPRSFMVEVDDPSIKGAMLTNCGRYAIPAIDAMAYAIGKKEKPPFVAQEQQKSEHEEDPIPDELLCVICQDLLSDAVVIPCCGNSYCDDCIRTTLLDSEDHVCPSCSQSDVSPDTLIANKFLRQAVNNFKKERGYTNSYKSKVAASKSQSSHPTPSPAPLLLSRQSLLQKPHLSPYRQQQESTLVHSKAAKTPPLTLVPVAPPTAPCSATVSDTPSTSSQPAQTDGDICDKKAERETHSGLAADPSLPLASIKNPTAAPSQPIPLVTHHSDAEQLTVGVDQQPSSNSASNPPLSAFLDSSSSSAAGPSEGQNQANTQLLPPSSSSSASFSLIPPPLFPPPVFHTIPPTHLANCSYPPGYLPPTPIWTPAAPQGSPIPSLCSSSSSIHVSKEWYEHQRRTQDRSRGSSKRRSSSNSKSKSAKSRFSHSYSRSSSRSRSRSRSRSQGRSRARSPYSQRRDLQSRSRPSSYSYGYKRSHSPTPSSSSSPRGRYQSTSKSPRNHHHSRHHSKRSSSSSCSSRRRGESSRRDAGGSATSSYMENRNQSSSLEPEIDRERYLQWKKEYTEWCEKYFSSYVGQFHQLPLPPFLTVPPLCPQWEDRERWRFYSHGSNSRYQAHDRRPSRRDDQSPSSESSSYSRSSTSHSSSDGQSTTSHSPSNSRSSLSHKDNEGCSPRSRLSSEDRSTPSDDRVQTRTHPESCAENYSQIRVKQMREGEEELLEKPFGDEKNMRSKAVKEFSPLKHEEKRKGKEVVREEGLSLPASAESEDKDLKKRKRNTELPACLSDTPVREVSTGRDATESLRSLPNRDEIQGKHHESKVKELKHSERERDRRRDKYSHSGRARDRHNQAKPREQPHRSATGREESPEKSRASDSRSTKSSKRKREDQRRDERERSPAAKHPSSKHPEAKTAKTHQSRNSQSPKPLDKEKQKTEKNTGHGKEMTIWEGGIKVKPQRKISININLEKKREDETTDQPDTSNLGSITEKPEGNTECAGVKEEETLNKVQMGTEANEDTESNKHPEIQAPTEPQAEEEPSWDQTFPTDASGPMSDKTTVEDDTEEDLNLWFCAFGEAEPVEKGVMEDENVTVTVSVDRSDQAVEKTATSLVKVGEEGIALEPTWAEDKVRVEDSNESTSQRTEDQLYHDDLVAMIDERENPAAQSFGVEENQEEKNMQTVEENSQDQAADGQNLFPALQVSCSRWEKKDKDGPDGGEKTVSTDTPAAAQPHPSVTVTSRETERDNDHQRQGSKEMEREQDRVTVTGKDKEQKRNYHLSASNQDVSPSGGKDETDGTSYTHRDPERDRQRDRVRRHEEERQERNHRERSKEHRREKEKERNKDKKWDRSSDSAAKREKLSSFHSSTSHDSQRGHRQRESSHRSASSVDEKPSSRGKERKRAAEASDQNPTKTFREASPARKSQESRRSHHHSNRQDPSRTHRHQSVTTSGHHSTPSRPQCKDTELLPFESSRKSPDWGWIHNKSRI